VHQGERDGQKRAGPELSTAGLRKVLTGTGWLVMGTVVSVAVPFLLTPIMLDRLGDEGFGFYAVVIAVVGYFSALDLGLSAALSRNVAFYAAQGRLSAVRQLNVIGVSSYLLLGLVLSPLLVVLDGPIVNVLDLSEGLHDAALHVLWWAYVLIFVSLATSTFRSLLMGLQQMRIVALADIVTQLVFAVAVVWLLDAGKGLDGVLIASYLRVGVLALVLATAARRHVRPLFSLAVQRPVLTGVLSFGGWMQVNNLCSIVLLETDRIVIGGFVGVVSVTRYEVANRLAMTVRLFPLQFVGALMPAATQMHAAGEEARLNDVYIRGTRLLALLSLGLGGFLVGAATPLFEVWLGRMVPDSAPILALLVVTFCLNNLTGVGTMVLRAVGKPRKESYYGILATVSNLALTLALAPAFGLYGIMIGTLVSAVVGTVYFLVTFHRMRGLSWRSTLLGPLARLLVAVFLAAGALGPVTAAMPAGVFTQRLVGVPVLTGLAAGYLALLLVASRVVGFVTMADLTVARGLVTGARRGGGAR
jgi:O-antigen/teichoic acid export membrane protein